MFTLGLAGSQHSSPQVVTGIWIDLQPYYASVFLNASDLQQKGSECVVVQQCRSEAMCEVPQHRHLRSPTAAHSLCLATSLR